MGFVSSHAEKIIKTFISEIIWENTWKDEKQAKKFIEIPPRLCVGFVFSSYKESFLLLVIN